MRYLINWLDGSDEIINNLQAGQSLAEQDQDQLGKLYDWLDTMLYVLDWGGADAKVVLDAAAYAYVEVHGELLIRDMRNLKEAIGRYKGLDRLENRAFLNGCLARLNLPPIYMYWASN